MDRVADEMDIAPGERDQRVAALDIVPFQPPLDHAERRLAFEFHDFQRLAQVSRDALDQRAGFGRSQQIDGAGGNPHERRRPGPATVRVGQHLDLVDHRDIDRLIGIEHFDGRSQMPGIPDPDLLLAGQQSRRSTVPVETVRYLQRQQPERRQIKSGPGLLQRFQRPVGLAGVGRAHHQHQPAPHAARHREKPLEPGEIEVPVDIGAASRLRPLTPPDIVFAIPPAEDFVGVLMVAAGAGQPPAQTVEGPAVIGRSRLRRVMPEPFGKTPGLLVQAFGQDAVGAQPALQVGVVQSAQFVHVDQPGHREPDRVRHAGPRQFIGHDQPDTVPRIPRMQRDMGAVEDTP